MKDKKLHNINKTGFKTPDAYFKSVEDSVFNKLKQENISDIKDTGYNVPDAYFQSIEEKVINKLNNEVSLDKITDSGFKTPDNYFETLENTIFTNLKEDKAGKVIPLFSRKNILYISSIAAAVMVMFGVFMRGEKPLDMELVETYLEQQDLNPYDIASLLTEDDLSQEDFGIINDSFNEESLEDYLIDNANLEDFIEQ